MFYFQDNDIVVPGDVIAKGNDLKARDGTYKDGEKIIAQNVGMVSVHENDVNVIPLKGFYVPEEGDYVIGFILSSSLTSWDVYIRSTYPARLSASDFLARRVDPDEEDIRNHLSRGDVIYGQIKEANRYGSSTLTTDQDYLGKLEGGHILKIKPPRVPRVIGRQQSMLSLLREEAKVLVGNNGFIYIETDTEEKFEVLRKVIKRIEREAFVSGLTERIKEYLSQELDIET